MTTDSIEIDNLKCGGGGASIANKLMKQKSVSKVTVDLEQSSVPIE